MQVGCIGAAGMGARLLPAAVAEEAELRARRRISVRAGSGAAAVASAAGRGRGGGRRSEMRAQARHRRFSVSSTMASASIASAISTAIALYVGVIAQEVQTVRPDAVTRGADGYLRVSYDRLGLKFQTYEQWLASGARVPMNSQ